MPAMYDYTEVCMIQGHQYPGIMVTPPNLRYVLCTVPLPDPQYYVRDIVTEHPGPEYLQNLTSAIRNGAKVPPLVGGASDEDGTFLVHRHGLEDGNHRWVALYDAGVREYECFVPILIDMDGGVL